MRCIRVFELVILLILILTIPLTSLGQGPADSPLTNADVMRMVKAGIPEATILRLMQVSETSFTTSANALIELKHHHVPDSVINALLDTRSAAIGNQTEALASDSVAVEPRTPGVQRLPNFDAAVRFNAKTNAKIAVRQNHIKVESSGHPLFSLSWKENNSH